MPVNFTNINSVWTSILAETLRRLGLSTAVICPGSRSAPLAIAFTQQEGMEAISVLDERSAAFFALGIARQSGLPVVLICTSGTAGANFYPAVIEAKESRVPLLVLTADRPAELRDCRAGQTIDQLKLFGHFPNWQAELALPSLDARLLAYLRQTVIHAAERSLWPVPGPVHLNLPFREPLAPLPQAEAMVLESHFPEDFFAAVEPLILPAPHRSRFDFPPIPLQDWQHCSRGVMIAGPAQPLYPEQYCTAIAQLSQALQWPVLAEGLSPLRNYGDLNPYLISTYDLILRDQQLGKQLAPELVIRIGELPTSKELRRWLDLIQPRQWIVDPGNYNLEPLHGKTSHLRLSIEQLAQAISSSFAEKLHPQPELPDGPINKGGRNLQAPQTTKTVSEPTPSTQYLERWCAVEAQVRQALDQAMTAMNTPFEGKAAWLLSQALPPNTPLFIANSMPVRDVEFFWRPGNSRVRLFFNRGANGIDGNLSTALGTAHRNQSSVLLLGDLALLHDTNGFLIKNKLSGHLTIVLINNNGGGIFEMLPIANFRPAFEEFFATPQNIDFSRLCATYDVEHQLIQSWEHLTQCLNSLPTQGIRVLELRTDRKADAKWRQENLDRFVMNEV